MFAKYKNDIYWISLTLSVILFLNIVYMYSRDKTLSTVEKNQFKLFTNILHTTSLSHKNFKQMTNALTIIPTSSKIKKRQALFHIALITKNGCIENSVHTRNKPFLCDNFPSSEKIKELIQGKTQEFEHKGKKRKSYEYIAKSLVPDESDVQAYMIKKRNRSNKWIIAKKRYLKNSSELSKFYFFITKRYIQKTSLKSKFYYTQYATYMILFLSFFLWLINKLQEQKRIRKYNKYQTLSLENQKKIHLLETKYNNDKIKRFELEEKILEIEKNLINTDNTSKAYKEEQLKQIGILRRKEGVLATSIDKDKKQIIKLEKNSFDLENNLNKERSQLQDHMKDVEYKKLENTTTQLKLLWRHEPSWIERQKIEQATSLKKTNLPFTLTQGFIAFEKYIDAEIRKLDSSGMLLRDSSFNLYSKIDFIAKKYNFSKQDRRSYHDIRKSRNRWFHSAIYPDVIIMNALVELLNDKDVNIIL